MPFRLIYGAWMMGIALQFVLCAVMLFRRTWKPLPVFAGYAMFSLFQSVLGYALRGMPRVYVSAYWICETVGFILGLAVIYEIFTRLLSSYPALGKLARAAFRWTVGFLLAASVLVGCFHAPVEGGRFVAGFVVLEQATRIAEVGLIAFLFSFARIFGLHWRQNIFGITLGLGLFMTVELVGITMRAYFGIAAWPAWNVARAFSFDFGMLIWIGYLLIPERVAVGAELPKRAQLEQWNQAIMELIHQ